MKWGEPFHVFLVNSLFHYSTEGCRIEKMVACCQVYNILFLFQMDHRPLIVVSNWSKICMAFRCWAFWLILANHEIFATWKIIAYAVVWSMKYWVPDLSWQRFLKLWFRISCWRRSKCCLAQGLEPHTLVS